MHPGHVRVNSQPEDLEEQASLSEREGAARDPAEIEPAYGSVSVSEDTSDDAFRPIPRVQWGQRLSTVRNHCEGMVKGLALTVMNNLLFPHMPVVSDWVRHLPNPVRDGLYGSVGCMNDRVCRPHTTNAQDDSGVGYRFVQVAIHVGVAVGVNYSYRLLMQEYMDRIPEDAQRDATLDLPLFMMNSAVQSVVTGRVQQLVEGSVSYCGLFSRKRTAVPHTVVHERSEETASLLGTPFRPRSSSHAE